jgi:hypothetical protein
VQRAFIIQLNFRDGVVAPIGLYRTLEILEKNRWNLFRLKKRIIAKRFFRDRIGTVIEGISQTIDGAPNEELHCLNIDWMKIT